MPPTVRTSARAVYWFTSPLTSDALDLLVELAGAVVVAVAPAVLPVKGTVAPPADTTDDTEWTLADTPGVPGVTPDGTPVPLAMATEDVEPVGESCCSRIAGLLFTEYAKTLITFLRNTSPNCARQLAFSLGGWSGSRARWGC